MSLSPRAPQPPPHTPPTHPLSQPPHSPTTRLAPFHPVPLPLPRPQGKILVSLNFHLTSPSSLIFLQRFTSIAGLPADEGSLAPVTSPESRPVMLARYLIELALIQSHLQRHTPSRIAAASILLALKAMGRTAWVRRRRRPPPTHTHVCPPRVSLEAQTLRSSRPFRFAYTLACP